MRVVDEHNYPPNIAVFQAKSIEEAVRKADALMREEHIQGAVWLRDTFNLESDIENCKQSNFSFFTAFRMLFRHSLDNYSKRLLYFLGRIMPTKIIASYREFSFSEQSDRHIDADESYKRMKQERDDSAFFCGLMTRLIVTERGPCTILYDEGDSWTVKNNDWLFFKTAMWGTAEALEHCVPEFKGSHECPSRKLRIFDFNCR